MAYCLSDLRAQNPKKLPGRSFEKKDFFVCVIELQYHIDQEGSCGVCPTHCSEQGLL